MWVRGNTGMTSKNNRAPLLHQAFASFQIHQWNQTGVTVWKHSVQVKIDDFWSRMTLKSDRWPWKTKGHIFNATSSILHHFVAIGEFKLELQSGDAQFGWNLTIFKLCDLEICRITLKNNREPLLRNIKLCAPFNHHLSIQTGVTVRKQLSWVLTSVTLNFDLWPWPFVWSSPWSLVITPKNFMMIWWWDHSQGSTLSFLAGCPKSHFLGWYRNFLVYSYLKLDNQVVS